MQITLEIDDVTASLLAALSDRASVEDVIDSLISSATQGVYRPGAWERPWLVQAFEEKFIDRLEAGDPYGRPEMNRLFQRPKPTGSVNATNAS